MQTAPSTYKCINSFKCSPAVSEIVDEEMCNCAVTAQRCDSVFRMVFSKIQLNEM